MSSSSPNSDTSSSPHESLGDNLDLIHVIGTFLHCDKDSQSLGRMSVACRAYKKDLKGLFEGGKAWYRSVDVEELSTMPLARMRVVKHIDGLFLIVDSGIVKGVTLPNVSLHAPVSFPLEVLEEITSVTVQSFAAYPLERDFFLPPSNIRKIGFLHMKHGSFGMVNAAHAIRTERFLNLSAPAGLASLKLCYPKLEKLELLDELVHFSRGDHELEGDAYQWGYGASQLRSARSAEDLQVVTYRAVEQQSPWVVKCQVRLFSNFQHKAWVMAFDGHLDGHFRSNSIEHIDLYLNKLCENVEVKIGDRVEGIEFTATSKPSAMISDAGYDKAISVFRSGLPIFPTLASKLLAMTDPDTQLHVSVPPTDTQSNTTVAVIRTIVTTDRPAERVKLYEAVRPNARRDGGLFGWTTTVAPAGGAKAGIKQNG